MSLQIITLALGLLAGALACFGPPGRGLAILAGIAIVWPEYLRFDLGPTMLSAPRIVCIMLLLRMLFGSGHMRTFKWRRIDTLVVCLYIWIVTASAISSSPRLNTMIGSAMDTTLVYLVARIAMSNARNAKAFIHTIVWFIIPIAFLAIIEARTGRSPYMQFQQHFAWAWGADGFSGGRDMRLGMHRAMSSTIQPIYFGVTMAIMTGWLIALRKFHKSMPTVVVACVLGMLGTLASLSSGPWTCLLLVIVLNVFYWTPYLIRPAILGFIAILISAELFSNRHFYHLIDYLALNSGTAWYRSRLLEVAFIMLPEYWALGYGPRTVAHWGKLVDGRGMIDVVNNYVIIAINAGILGPILYISVKIGAIRMMARKAGTKIDISKATLYGFIALVLAVALTELSVGLYSIAQIANYMTLGIAVSAAGWSLPETTKKPTNIRYGTQLHQQVSK